MLETWKAIPGYEGFYSVSNLGRVKSHSRTIMIGRGCTTKKVIPETILATIRSGPGLKYTKVNLRHQGGGKIKAVHRLVATCFLENPQNKPLVLHNDGDTNNNRASNLRWGTAKENAADRTKHGRTCRLGGKKRVSKALSDEIRQNPDNLTAEQQAVFYALHTQTIYRHRNAPH